MRASDRDVRAVDRRPAGASALRAGADPAVPLALLALGALPLAATVPWLSWLLLLPVAGAVWVLRARVRVTPEALVVSNGLRRRAVPWADVEGFDVPPRGPVRLLHGGARTPLLPLSRRELPELLRAAEAVAGPGSTG